MILQIQIKMKAFSSVTALVLLATLSCNQPNPEEFTYPAEFEKIDAIWMNWNVSAFHTDGRPERIILEMTKEITPNAKMNMIVINDSVKTAAVQSMLNYGIDTSKVKFYFYPRHNRFVRDYGPVFLRGNKGTLKGIDFNYNCFGECEPNSTNALRGDMDNNIEKQLGLEVIKTAINSEGGNREFNGKGIMLTVESVELHRNPNMSKKQLEAEYKRVLGVKKIIWLKKGLINDDKAQSGILPCDIYGGGTGGHIDEFCRFADARTILLAQQSKKENICDSLAEINLNRLEENYAILKSAVDQDGVPFKIIRVPTAPFDFDTVTIKNEDTSFFAGSHIGETVKVFIASSYLNFIIANKVVLIPKYYREGGLTSTKQKDEEVVRIFQQVFPGKVIVQIDVREFNYGGGGMHCATVQQATTNIK
jgi:agmatine deiminase